MARATMMDGKAFPAVKQECRLCRSFVPPSDEQQCFMGETNMTTPRTQTNSIYSLELLVELLRWKKAKRLHVVFVVTVNPSVTWK